LIALAEYNRNPFSIADREMTFAQLYEKFYKNKYEYSGRTYSRSSMDCTKSAYGYCSVLYDLAYSQLRADDFRGVLSQKTDKGKLLSHSMQEHIKNLFSQMDKFALQNDIISKGYSSFAAITVKEDDTPGVPFTAEDEDIDLKAYTFKGGLKTAAGKNRIVPIHSRIQGFVEHRLSANRSIYSII